MDPIELLQLCRDGALQGVPPGVTVPRLFTPGDFEDLWRRDHAQVRRLLDETLTAPFPGDGLELLLRSGALHALIPELVAIKDLGDDPGAALHKDVWSHTKQVVSTTPNQLELRWGALMHDIGKSRTRAFDGRKVTFHNHDIVGARMLDGIERRLDLFRDDDSLFITVRILVLNHLRPAGYKKTWSDSGVRRLLTDLGGMRNFERLMDLSRADLTTKNVAKRNGALARGRELEERVKLVYSQDVAPKLPKGTMGIIMSRVAAKPGAWLNVIRQELETAMASGLLPDDRDMDFYVAEGLKLATQYVENGGTDRKVQPDSP
jgi:poly(A) polymerase